MAERQLFGTDGVRGRANVDLTPEIAFGMAAAAGESGDGPVIIGRDTRRSGPMLAASLQAGFNSVGVDTVDLGIIPVGAVSRLTRDTGSTYGVMISASHNPAEDNGIKFFGRDGSKLSDEREAALEKRFSQGPPWDRTEGAMVGMHSTMTDSVDRYVRYLLDMKQYSLRGIEITLDCANGAAFLAGPRLFEDAGANIEVIHAEPDGMNINAECGATDVASLAEAAAGKPGFAFDGDADRLIAVDEDGQTINGDVILAIFANHMKQRGELKKDLVVATVMSNLGFHKAMKQIGVSVLETAVGDRYVLEEMRKSRAVLGGEQSGHIILEDRATGDGVRSAHRLAEVMAATGRELRELRTVMTEFPQVLVNVPVRDREMLPKAKAIWRAVGTAEQKLGDRGRILVRASGTESLVRVMAEAETQSMAEDVVGDIVTLVEATLG
ncbi:MAG: phosphoglucosamine mutase [bacterium]|nr:phosphoglucosamine mutase [bacterium]